jgi:hypothetical protein
MRIKMKTETNQGIFNRDFYPTPIEVIEQMQLDIEGDIILEPSAGSGNIIEYAMSNMAKEVIFCEIVPDLAEICKSKGRFLKHDFLKVNSEDISHINQIVMNPPFTADEKHIIHAWNIAPSGCIITSLCNTETIENFRYGGRFELKMLIENHGYVFHLGECFSTSERKTNVNVSCVKLYKPVNNDNINFEGFYLDAEFDESTGEGIITFNEVKAIVNSYIGAVKCWDEFEIVNSKMCRLTSTFGANRGFKYDVSYGDTVTSKEHFTKVIQRNAWDYIFKLMNIGKFVTKGVNEDINKFINKQHNIPFTVKNIYKMLEIIVGTREQTMNRAIVEAVDNFTRHTNENRYGIEGWKTNSGYMLNKKFITGWISEYSFSGIGLGIREYNGNFEKISDLTKALCFITGIDYDNIPKIGLSSVPKDDEGKHIKDSKRNGNYLMYENSFKPNTWYDWGFFEFKVFKKGSGHFKFKDVKVWEQLNRQYAKIKGQVLPEKI